jgi:hypothetical protein
MQSTRYACQIVMKHGFSQQIVEKYPNIKFHENPTSGSQVVCKRTGTQTDIHGEVNNSFFKFCERA